MPLPMTMTSFVVSADVDVDVDAAVAARRAPPRVVVGLVAVALIPRGARGVGAARDGRLDGVDEWRHNRAHVAVVDATAADGRLASRARRTTRVRSLELARQGADGIARAPRASRVPDEDGLIHQHHGQTRISVRRGVRAAADDRGGDAWVVRWGV